MGCSNSDTRDRNKITEEDKQNKNEKAPQGISKTNISDLAPNLATLGIMNKEHLSKYYKIIEKLGSGTFGRVYKAIHLKTKQQRAIKVVKREVLKLQDDEKVFLKEIELLATLSHPNIIKIFEFFVDESNYYVVQEFAPGGELYDQIYKMQYFTEVEAAKIMYQLLSAVSYLHSNGIVHRDLKPENIMLDSKSQVEYNIKIIDFGAANYCKPKEGQLTLKVGTPYYIAPEVIKKKYDLKCDVWSCGVIMYILLCGYPPFDGEDDQEIMKRVVDSDIKFDETEWGDVSKLAKDLIKRMLKKDPSSRVSAEECIGDPWMKYYYYNKTDEISKTNLMSQYNKLKNFSARTKLQQASIAFLVHQLSTNETTKELRKMFLSLDVTGDGKLSYSELREGFDKYYNDGVSKMTDEEFKELINKLDSDGNGYVEYEEFLSASMNLELLLSEKNLQMAFSFFDKDGSGKLDAQEIKGVLGMVTKSEKQGKDDYIKKIIEEIDINKDGEVSYEEFKTLMKKVLQNK